MESARMSPAERTPCPEDEGVFRGSEERIAARLTTVPKVVHSLVAAVAIVRDELVRASVAST